MLKQTIKAMIPDLLTAQFDNVVDRRQLSAVSDLDFESGFLRPARMIDLASIFASAETAAAWSVDRKAIADYYQDTDLLLGVNPGDRRAIYSLIMASKPHDVLEVGTHIGASTIHIAAALKRLGEGRSLTTVDIEDVNAREHAPWKEAGMARSPAQTAADLGVGDLVRFVVSPARTFLESTGQKFDFVFLDGSHASCDVYREVSAALRILNPDGVILLHDYYPDGRPLFPDGRVIGGPYRAMVRVRDENPEIDVVPLGSLPWPTKQGTRATTLALVVRRTEAF